MKIEENKTYVGVVEDNNDPKKLGRVRVRVLDIFDDLKVEDIPWATPYKDLNGNGFNIPDKGKVLLVVFDQGDKYKPEFISSDHFNTNLEKKVLSLTGDNYISMKSLLFDHKTQIYVNDSEGLKIDYKYNNVNITENTIDLNLKDNSRHVNIGDATAAQQAILGNHWMDWFDEFVDNLMGNNGGPYLGNMGAPVVANPALIQVLQKYKKLRDPVFLSHHVNIVDNNKVTTVRNTKREDNAQLGDSWNSTKQENNLTTTTDENFKPQDGPKPEYNDKHVEPPTSVTASTNGTASATNSPLPIDIKPVNSNPPLEPLTSPKSNPKVDKLIKFMKSKGYTVYEEEGVLNILGIRSSRKDKGEISNKFDDTMAVFYINSNKNWELVEYQITTVPGFVPKTELLPKNVAILALGQYVDQCRMGIYQNDKNHKYLSISNCVIHRNDVQDRYNFKSSTETGSFPISIHRSSESSSENVFNYSEGAQVFKNITQYNQFILLCENQLAKKDTFTYTLCNMSDLDKFVPDSEDSIIESQNEVSNKLSNWEPGKKIMSDILSEKDVKVEWYILNGADIDTYKGFLKSEKGRDFKEEEFSNKDLISLEKTIREEAKKDFDELRNIVDTNAWIVGKKISGDTKSFGNIRVQWIITNGDKPGNYKGILTSTKGNDIKAEEFTSSNLEMLEETIREEADKDFNELKSQ